MPGFPDGPVLLPCMTRARWQHRLMASQVVAVSVEDDLSLEQVAAPAVELLHQMLG